MIDEDHNSAPLGFLLSQVEVLNKRRPIYTESKLVDRQHVVSYTLVPCTLTASLIVQTNTKPNTQVTATHLSPKQVANIQSSIVAYLIQIMVLVHGCYAQLKRLSLQRVIFITQHQR